MSPYRKLSTQLFEKDENQDIAVESVKCLLACLLREMIYTYTLWRKKNMSRGPFLTLTGQNDIL